MHHPSPTGSRARAIALYLPQFHPIAENDDWWGTGFTEWTNVAKATPMFAGHYQPHVPADLGFYDLRVPETREAQAAMARRYGIEGFCYYHYWFAGRRVLERPFTEVLQSGKPDFPFCLCWANQTWTGIWHGAPDRVLIEQTYPGRADHEAHFEALLPAFRDRRYIRVDDKPLFVIFVPADLPDSVATLSLWRAMARDAGLPGLHIAGISFSRDWDPVAHGFDAKVDQPPLQNYLHSRSSSAPLRWPDDRLEPSRELPTVVPARSFAKLQELVASTDHLSYPLLFHAFDNTPRSGRHGIVLDEATPELFQSLLEVAVRGLASRPPDRRIVFLKSWNEWAEGNHLEPDLKTGNAFLEVVRKVLSHSR